MSIIDYIVLAFSLGIMALVAVQSCVSQTKVALLRGLTISSVMSLSFVVFVALGMWLANKVRFDIPEVDSMISFGLIIVVVVKLLFSIRKGNVMSAYNIQQMSTLVSFVIALGINALILGLGVGFVGQLGADILKMAIPLVLVVWLMTMWGIMLGRRNVDIRHRRWQLIGILCLVVIAFKVAFFK